MKTRTSRIVKRVLSGMLSLVMIASLASALPSASAQETDKYPYVLFALSENDGAITVNAQSFNVNGDIATNGSLYTAGNMNLNGMKTENVGESMPFFVDKIEEVYFSGEYEFYTEDYILVKTNVNHSKPIKVQGNYTLDGNINSSSALIAQNNIHIEGNTINANNSVLCAQYGNISIDCLNVNFSGLIYAPMGTVEITAENISLNSVVVIANEIILDANNVNVGYSSWAGQIVETEYTETPDEEIDYEKDTDEDGIPDFIEEEFGTDINSSDTDNDGLSDLFELVNGTTDPTIPDTDSDGFMDEQETNGIRIQNGQFVTIDPENADSDFDALGDGEEIDTSLCYKDTPVINISTGETIHVAGYYYVMYSDPNDGDTDGDGYMDGEDIRPNWYNSMHFNITSSLNNAPFWEAVDVDINKSRLTYETNSDADFILKSSALKIAFKKAALIGSATPFATVLTTDIAWKNVDSGQTPKAYRALLHFFENSGSSYEYTEGEVCDLILSHKNNTIHMLDNLALLAQEADDYISNNESIYLSTDYNSCYKALCYYNKDAKCDYSHTAVFESDYCADWYNTFGEANCGMNLYIECIDGVYSMTYRYYIIDMYNWHRTSPLGEILNDMHIAGVSKEYLMSGFFEGSLAWQSGEELSADSIKEKVYSDMVNHLVDDGVVNAGFQEFYTNYNIYNDAYPHYDAFRIKERFV